jgi:hypothetical protein
MSIQKWARATLAAALLPPVLVMLWGSPSFASQPSNLVALDLSPASRVTSAKSPTSRLAKTDPSLLNRRDATRVSIVVKLSYDSIATYAGGVAGMPATSPSVTGRPLSNSAAEKRYAGYIAGLENAFVAQLSKRVVDATVGQRLKTVYGGIALTVPANRIADVLAIPGVVAVQADSLNKPLTDSSPAFIGATSLYPQLGGTANAGKGVIFGRSRHRRLARASVLRRPWQSARTAAKGRRHIPYLQLW